MLRKLSLPRSSSVSGIWNACQIIGYQLHQCSAVPQLQSFYTCTGKYASIYCCSSTSIVIAPSITLLTYHLHPQTLSLTPALSMTFKFGCSKCILWTLLTIVCLASSYVGYAFLQGLTTWFKVPHSYLFQDLSVPYKPSEAVRPLVDINQTFDIVATVWLRQNTLDLTLESGNTTHGPILG